MRGLDPKHIKIGTCSWKYDSWKGLVYSDQVENYLAEYAKQYPIVEIDQWFWSLFGNKVVMPKPEVVSEYVSTVPKDFMFSIKVPNSITLTHHYKKRKSGPLEPNSHFLSNDLMEDFLRLLAPMKHQINSLIFQFEYLNKTKIPNQGIFLEQLQDFIGRCPTGYRYCVETRNQNYLNNSYFETLNRLGLSHVFLQGYWMPPIFEVYGRFKEYIKNHTVIRLHGSDRSGIEKVTGNQWDQIVEPKDGDLNKLNIMVRNLLSNGVKVTLNVNNHYEGSAPKTIDRFISIYTGGLL